MPNSSRRAFLTTALSAPVMAGADAPSHQVTAQRPGAEYMLRYFLRSETAEAQTADLIAYCRANRIPHVILFSANNWDMGWNLPTLEEARQRVDLLQPLVRRMRGAGLHVSLNMWTTIGHEDLGRDERTRFRSSCCRK
jgi:hypothetical protein